MPLFDACVYPFPVGDITQKRLALELSELGYQGMVAIGGEHHEDEFFTTYSGELIYQTAQIQRKISTLTGKRSPHKRKIINVCAGENRYNRTVLSIPGVDILSGIEQTSKDSFDKFCAATAADRGVAIDICLKSLVQSTGVPRQKIMRRFEELFTLQRRYEFQITLSSGASTLTDLRSPRAVKALLSTIYDDHILEESFETISRIFYQTGAVREIFP